MTNSEYFRMTLTDKELADMAIHTAYSYSDRLFHAFKKWCAETGSVKSNQKKNNPSRFFWQKIFNTDTGEWESTGRTHNVSIQLFLSQKYEKKYWERG